MLHACPRWELVDQDRVAVSSVDLLGEWVLLYWYPKAETPGCIAQAEGIRDQIEAFDELGCVVMGASFDEPEANRRFRERYHLPFRLLSDLDRKVALALGVVDRPDAAAPHRIALLIDPDGNVVQRLSVEDPTFFAEHALDALEAAQQPPPSF